MNAHELLDALHVAGIAVWVEQGRLGIYPPCTLQAYIYARFFARFERWRA